MPARIEALGPLQSLLFSRHPGILLILLAGAKEMDACRGMPAQPAGIPCRMPADCRHPAGIPSRHPAGIPSRHPAGIPEPSTARGGGLPAVQPRLASPGCSLTDKESMFPFPSDSLGKKRSPTSKVEDDFSFFQLFLSSVSACREGWRAEMANKPRQYFFVKMPVQRASFNADGGTGLPSLSALKERRTTGLLTK